MFPQKPRGPKASTRTTSIPKLSHSELPFETTGATASHMFLCARKLQWSSTLPSDYRWLHLQFPLHWPSALSVIHTLSIMPQSQLLYPHLCHHHYHGHHLAPGHQALPLVHTGDQEKQLLNPLLCLVKTKEAKSLLLPGTSSPRQISIHVGVLPLTGDLESHESPSLRFIN